MTKQYVEGEGDREGERAGDTYTHTDKAYHLNNERWRQQELCCRGGGSSLLTIGGKLQTSVASPGPISTRQPSSQSEEEEAVVMVGGNGVTPGGGGRNSKHVRLIEGEGRKHKAGRRQLAAGGGVRSNVHI